jgi:hypothetical protein
MKQLLFLLLFPCLAMAQYPSNGNQKITLGEQTTADGLIWRGVAADTTLTAKSDTAAYFVLDTVNINLYTYKASATGRKWRQLGADTAAIAYVNTYGTQTINGAKTFSNNTIFNGSLIVGTTNIQSGTNINGLYLESRVNSAITGNMVGINLRMLGLAPTTGSYTIANMYGLRIGQPVLQSNVTVTNSYGAYIARTNDAVTGGVTTKNYALVTEDAAGNVGLGITNPSQRLVIKGRMIMFGGNDAVFFSSNGVSEDKWHFGVEGSAPDSEFSITQSGVASRLKIIKDGDVLMGYSTDQGAYKLQVNGQIFATNATIATSDRKFKENILPLSKGLEIVNKLKPVTFNFISDTENNFSQYEEVGFIAQDVDRALSTETFAKSIVKAADDSEPTSTMGLATQNLIPSHTRATSLNQGT